MSLSKKLYKKREVRSRSGFFFLLTRAATFDTLKTDVATGRNEASSVVGRVAEWLGTGLQNPLLRFNSGRDLTYFWVSGGTGIHATLKMLCQKHVGSSPT